MVQYSANFSLSNPQAGTVSFPDSGQKSLIRKLKVTYDVDPAGDYGVVLTKLNGPYGAPPGTQIAVSIVSVSGLTATFSFSGPGTEYGSLEDGNYSLVIGDFSTSFHRFFGDVDGDREVKSLDLSVMQSSMGTRIGMANYRAYLDFASRGYISSVDYASFQRRYTYRLNEDGTITQIDPSL